jgi:hypothetical protein
MAETQFELKEGLHAGVNPFIEPSKVMGDLRLNDIDLGKSMLDQSGMVAYYGELYARAVAQTAQAKQEAELVEAQVIKLLRASIEEKEKKAPSDARLGREVITQSAYQDAQTKLRDAKYIENLMDAVFSAFDHRRSMLLQIARNEASERMGAPMITETDRVSRLMG